jgi:hypothetical protein
MVLIAKNITGYCAFISSLSYLNLKIGLNKTNASVKNGISLSDDGLEKFTGSARETLVYAAAMIKKAELFGMKASIRIIMERLYD